MTFIEAFPLWNNSKLQPRFYFWNFSNAPSGQFFIVSFQANNCSTCWTLWVFFVVNFDFVGPFQWEFCVTTAACDDFVHPRARLVIWAGLCAIAEFIWVYYFFFLDTEKVFLPPMLAHHCFLSSKFQRFSLLNNRTFSNIIKDCNTSNAETNSLEYSNLHGPFMKARQH